MEPEIINGHDEKVNILPGRDSFVIDDGRIESLGEYISPEELYKDLIYRVQKYHPSDDISMIEKAYKIADEAHLNQRRKSGEPYIIHPLYVANVLADLELDKETICAGLLHDVVEDTIVTKEEIEKEVGELEWDSKETNKSAKIRKVFPIDINNSKNHLKAAKEHIKMAEELKAIAHKYL